MSKIKTPSGMIVSPINNWKDIWKKYRENGWFEFFFKDDDPEPQQCAFFFEGREDECVYMREGGAFIFLGSRR